MCQPGRGGARGRESQEPSPPAGDRRIDRPQSGDQRLRIAGEAHRSQVGLEFTGPGEGELHQPAENRRKNQDQQEEQAHSRGRTGEHQRQSDEDEHHLADPGEGSSQVLGRGRDAEDPEVPVGDMCDLVGQNRRQLVAPQPAHEPPGQSDHRPITGIYCKGVHRQRRDQEQGRSARETGSASQLTAHSVDPRRLAWGQQTRPMGAEEPGRRNLAVEPEEQQAGEQGQGQSEVSHDPAAEAAEQHQHTAEPAHGVQEVAKAVAIDFGSLHDSDRSRTESRRRERVEALPTEVATS